MQQEDTSRQHSRADASSNAKMQRRISESVDEIFIGGKSRVSAAELHESLERLRLPCSEQIVQEIFAEADSNNDGYLDHSELMHYVRQREEEIATTFAQTFGSRGVATEDVSFEQLKQALIALGVKPTDVQVAAFLTRLDQSESGTISLAEFTAFVYLLPRVDVAHAFEAWLSNHVGGLDTGAEPGQVESSALVPQNKASEGAVFIAGACAGVVSRTATAPLDRVKMLMQVDVTEGYSAEKAKKRAARAAAAAAAAAAPGAPRSSGSGSSSAGGGGGNAGMGSESKRPPHKPPPVSRVRPDGVVSGLRGMYREGGFMAFYQGNTANVIKVMPESGVKFWAYDVAKNVVCANPNSPRVYERLLSGAFAGAASCIVIYPLEVVKTRLAVASPGLYEGVLHCMRHTVEREGVAALYKGLSASLLGIMPFSAIDLALYNTFKAELQRHRRSEPTTLTMLGCGAASSSLAQLATYPLALAKTRLQACGMPGYTPEYTGLVSCLTYTIKNEGVSGLYRGIVPNLLKAVPSISISYVVYENVKSALQGRGWQTPM